MRNRVSMSFAACAACSSDLYFIAADKHTENRVWWSEHRAGSCESAVSVLPLSPRLLVHCCVPAHVC